MIQRYKDFGLRIVFPGRIVDHSHGLDVDIHKFDERLVSGIGPYVPRIDLVMYDPSVNAAVPTVRTVITGRQKIQGGRIQISRVDIGQIRHGISSATLIFGMFQHTSYLPIPAPQLRINQNDGRHIDAVFGGTTNRPVVFLDFSFVRIIRPAVVFERHTVGAGNKTQKIIEPDVE